MSTVSRIRIARTKVLTFAVAALLAGGCASTPTVEGLYASPDFDAGATSGKELGVLGVVSVSEPIYRDQRLQYGTIIASSIRHEKGSYRLENPGYVAERVGEQTLQTMLDKYRDTGHLGLAELQAIADAAPEIGYVIVARIDRDDVQKDKSHYEWEQGSKPNVEVQTDASGNISVADVTTTSDKVQVSDGYTTTRSMSATFEVFDIPDGTTAWSGHVRKVDRRSNDELHTYDANNRFAQEMGEAIATGIVAGVSGTQTDYYPAPIEQSDLFAQLAAEFAKNLP
jgi:hypothetical protein